MLESAMQFYESLGHAMLITIANFDNLLSGEKVNR